MSGPVKRVFHYHASAHALSGQFTRPVQHLIEVQAATTLPTIGGHGNARVDDFRFNDFFSFKAGYTHVSGSGLGEDVKGFYTSLVRATLGGLNFLFVWVSERLSAAI